MPNQRFAYVGATSRVYARDEPQAPTPRQAQVPARWRTGNCVICVICVTAA
jgi:hypothetical protein